MTRCSGCRGGAAFTLLLALLVLAPALRAADRYEGLAYARNGDRLLYREIHWRHVEGGITRQLVLYRCPDGKPFARKQLLGSPSATAPDFDFVDGRDGYREGVRTRSGKREVYVQKTMSAPLQAKAIRVAADAVIDAGFDAAVRERWQSLAGGGTITIPFLLPSRFGFVPLQLAGSQHGKSDGEPALQLRMSVARWYGFALPTIELAYALDGHRLLEFKGIGSVRDHAGHYQDVRIVFPAANRATGVAGTEISAAAASPLVAQCGGAS